MNAKPRKSLIMASWDRVNEGLFYEWSVCTKGVEEHNSRGIIVLPILHKNYVVLVFFIGSADN